MFILQFALVTYQNGWSVEMPRPSPAHMLDHAGHSLVYFHTTDGKVHNISWGGKGLWLNKYHYDPDVFEFGSGHRFCGTLGMIGFVQQSGSLGQKLVSLRRMWEFSQQHSLITVHRMSHWTKGENCTAFATLLVEHMKEIASAEMVFSEHVITVVDELSYHTNDAAVISRETLCAGTVTCITGPHQLGDFDIYMIDSEGRAFKLNTFVSNDSSVKVRRYGSATSLKDYKLCAGGNPPEIIGWGMRLKRRIAQNTQPFYKALLDDDNTGPSPEPSRIDVALDPAPIEPPDHTYFQTFGFKDGTEPPFHSTLSQYWLVWFPETQQTLSCNIDGFAVDKFSLYPSEPDVMFCKELGESGATGIIVDQGSIAVPPDVVIRYLRLHLNKLKPDDEGKVLAGEMLDLVELDEAAIAVLMLPTGYGMTRSSRACNNHPPASGLIIHRQPQQKKGSGNCGPALIQHMFMEAVGNQVTCTTGFTLDGSGYRENIEAALTNQNADMFDPSYVPTGADTGSLERICEEFKMNSRDCDSLLREGAHLTDAVVAACGRLIEELVTCRVATGELHSGGVCILDPYFSTCVIDQSASSDGQPRALSFIRNKSWILQASKVIVPVCVSNHWFLLAFSQAAFPHSVWQPVTWRLHDNASDHHTYPDRRTIASYIADFLTHVAYPAILPRFPRDPPQQKTVSDVSSAVTVLRQKLSAGALQARDCIEDWEGTISHLDLPQVVMLSPAFGASVLDQLREFKVNFDDPVGCHDISLPLWRLHELDDAPDCRVLPDRSLLIMSVCLDGTWMVVWALITPGGGLNLGMDVKEQSDTIRARTRTFEKTKGLSKKRRDFF